ncbi:MAG: AzlD domain-containing protein [Alistipes sp.]|nr:AzlD domain-containing protein [Alistipes sp.]
MKLALYIFVMALVTYLIRMIPLTFFRRKIKSRYIRSFLKYIPYAVLGAMAIPEIFYSTGNIITAAVGTVIAVVLAFFDLPLIVVAVSASIGTFLTDLIIR